MHTANSTGTNEDDLLNLGAVLVIDHRCQHASAL
jgi:hypothetical protein